MRRRNWWALLILYAAAIFALSHTSVQSGALPFPYFDKLFHAAEFGFFLVLAWLATGGRSLRALGMTALYAGTDEVHQLFVATRTASYLDFAADLGGAALALAILLLCQRLWHILRPRILDPNDAKVER